MKNNLIEPILLYFYDADGVLQYTMDYYNGITWGRSWTGIGSFRITFVVRNEADFAIIKECAFVSINNHLNKFGLINKVEEDYAGATHNILITGTELKGLAQKRIVLNNVTINNTPCEIAKKLLNDNIINPTNTARKLAPFAQTLTISVDETDAEAVDYDAKFGTLNTEIKKLAEAYDFGWYATPTLTNGAITAINWYIDCGLNRTSGQTVNEPLLLSFDRNTIDDIVLEQDIRSTINCAVVGGKGKGTARKMTLVGDDYSGLNRNETYVEARNAEDSELPEKGKQALAEYGTEDITQVSPSVGLQNDFLRGEFAIGDVGTLITYGRNLRLHETTEIYEKGYCICKFTFGIKIANLSSLLNKQTQNYLNLIKAEVE